MSLSVDEGALTPTYAFWSVADGPFALILATALRSAATVGLREAVHVWSDSDVPGAVSHPVGAIRKEGCLFKLDVLRQSARHLPYDYLVWLDSDTVFVRHPGSLLRLVGTSDMHMTLESDAGNPANVRRAWWGCPLDVYVELMREGGVTSDAVYSGNAGLFVIRTRRAELMCEMATDFMERALRRGYRVPEEVGLAYAMHMLCGATAPHTLDATADVWASDWTGYFRGRLPDGQPWPFVDYLTGATRQINPAMVHALRSKRVMLYDALMRQDSPQATHISPTGTLDGADTAR